MTPKPKRKAPPANFLARFWREFLFTREFYFESDATPEDCANAIWEQLPRNGIGRRQDVSVYHISEDQRGFKIEVKRPNRISERITATTSGTIEYNASLQRTIIRGETAIGAENYIFTLLPAGFFSLPTLMIEETNQKFAYFFVVLLFFAPLFWLWFRDRHWIVQSLKKSIISIQPEMHEKAKITQPETFDTQEEMNGQYKGTAHTDHSAD